MDAKGCALLVILGLGFFGGDLWGQAARDSALPGAAEPGTGEPGGSGPEALIGLTLEEIYGRFGIPQALRAVRGGEEWQDDVVLVYPVGDFYVYRDRLWQVGVGAARGIRLGDSREAVLLALGEEAVEGEDYLVLALGGWSWPLALRVNLDSGRVAGIFVYRSDF
jgi:hypothetical protein